MNSEIAQAAAYIGAAIVMGMGSIGIAFGQGKIGSVTIEAMSRSEEKAIGNLRNTMLLALGIVETAAIYAFIVAMLLIYAI
ncbi:ATP synthase F0 subunit C [bacterium]|jgi:F-type H+-transporting ATPase subunit c|nr:ATP synthase F0 subunit C [bacterium]MBT3903293.1 ATP synthase F0 subunit C [bacterium]MBT4577492.1 ATP synthase F0 subunit C [bacterium]MBT5345792.1 ATP synthase F0 subunit C [bacterium]MBT6130867.1 ATP synthase F0 subunit C [bacterium]